MTNQQTASPEQKKGTGKALQIVLSLILFAGFVVFLFVPNAAGFEQSLFNQLLDLFKGESLFATTLAKASLYAVVGMYAVLLICTVASFFSKRNGAAALNFIKTLVCVAVTAFYAVVLIKEFEMTATEIFYDAKTYVAVNATSLSMILGLVGMVVLSIATFKGKGVVKLIYALIAGGFFVFATRAFVGGNDLQALFNGIDLGEGLSDTIAEYAFLCLAWGSIISLMLAVIGLALPHFGAIDLLRAIVIFIFAAACTVFSGLEDGFSSLTDNIGMLGFAGLALVQLVYTIIVVAVGHSKKKRQLEAEEDAADQPDAAPAEAQPAAEPFVFDSNDQMAIQGLEAPAQAQAEPAPEPAAAAAAAPAAEPVVSEEALHEAERANQAFDDAAQISFDDIAKTAAAQEEQAATAQEAEHAEYTEAVHEIPAQEKAEEKPFDFEQAKYDGKFNRAYADYTAQEEQRRAQAQQPYQQPYYGQPYGQPPYYGQAYAQQPPVAPPNGQSYYAASGYIPDAFFSSLTPAEKDEFDRLFISRIYGDNKRLPAYRLGGDNREFFTKIFVFMGRYRNVISDGLLEKIYNYSNSIR